ncbi:hypothetical protein Ptr902_10443 [Pyrenophora tritici-repentis]|nr:hypothetical protein Ptr902_10443 [Pyrenophora tritici-repentis]
MCLIFSITHPETDTSHFLDPFHCCDLVSTECKAGYHKFDLQEPLSDCGSCAKLHGLELDPDVRPMTYYPPIEDFDLEYVGDTGYQIVGREKAGHENGEEDAKSEAEAETEATVKLEPMVEDVFKIEEEKEEGGEVEKSKEKNDTKLDDDDDDDEEEEYSGSLRSWGSLSDVDSITSHWRLDNHISTAQDWYHYYTHQYAAFSAPHDNHYQGGWLVPMYGNQGEVLYAPQECHCCVQAPSQPIHQGGPIFPMYGQQGQVGYTPQERHVVPTPTVHHGGPVFPTYGFQDQTWYPPQEYHRSLQVPTPPIHQAGPEYTAYNNQDAGFHTHHTHHHAVQIPAFSTPPPQQAGPAFSAYGKQGHSVYIQHTLHHTPPAQQHPLPALQGPTHPPPAPNHQTGPTFPATGNTVPSSYMPRTPHLSPPKKHARHPSSPRKQQQKPAFSTPQTNHKGVLVVAPYHDTNLRNPGFFAPTPHTPQHSPPKYASPRKHASTPKPASPVKHASPQKNAATTQDESPNTTLHRNLVSTQLAQLPPKPSPNTNIHRTLVSNQLAQLPQHIRQTSPVKAQRAVFNTTTTGFADLGFPAGHGGSSAGGRFPKPLDAGLYAPIAYTSPVKGKGVDVFQEPSMPVKTQGKAQKQKQSGVTEKIPIFDFNTSSTPAAPAAHPQPNPQDTTDKKGKRRQRGKKKARAELLESKDDSKAEAKGPEMFVFGAGGGSVQRGEGSKEV